MYKEISSSSIGLRQKNQSMTKAEYKLKTFNYRNGQSDNTLAKPKWLKVRSASLIQHQKIMEIKSILRKQKLHTVCEEATCPNLTECFSKGTATFMIMGDICTRKCPFCDVAHGRPKVLDSSEPEHLATTIAKLDLEFVVITSVDRDDLRDGGANHFLQCIKAIRSKTKAKIEILVPDFLGKAEQAISILSQEPPNVFNHNLETVGAFYKLVRPGANYQNSLKLLRKFKETNQKVPTKSGLMLGLGETLPELLKTMQDLKKAKTDILTLGQYLQPSKYHLPVKKYWSPDEFEMLKQRGYQMGFSYVAAGPLVRSSYQAEIHSQELV